MASYTFTKHPDSTRTVVLVYSDRATGNNSATSTADNGILNGDTISSAVVTSPAGITTTTAAVNGAGFDYRGVTYPASTAISSAISGGTDGESYEIPFEATLASGDIVVRTLTVEVTASV